MIDYIPHKGRSSELAVSKWRPENMRSEKKQERLNT